jgi:hypothetical protein
VIVVALATLTLVAAAPPILTVAPETKFVPEIVTDVPPAVLPELGVIEEIVGAGCVLPPPPSDLGRIVLSFLSAPGDALTYVVGDNTI